MKPYNGLNVYYGDLHNHCGISYGHGPLEDALKNARAQLDFCSITGHAHWPDMPVETEENQPILDFHHKGFARLKKGWAEAIATLREHNKEGEFLTFPGFEIHFCATGDRTIVYRDHEGEILYADSLEDLHQRLRALKEQGVESLAFPHHIGYLKGRRGIDWDSFDPEMAPVVELISMHGCSEGSDSPRPFLHSMGPSDWKGTAQYGWEQGHIFGVVGCTDHHSGHPGSYGHGVTGVWADRLTRDAVWDAIQTRRTYALTGDRMALKFALNGLPMGSVAPASKTRKIEIQVGAGGALDYVDIVKNNRVLHRFSECDVDQTEPSEMVRTKLFLEVGWGEKKKEAEWDVQLGISAGRVLSIEPRFRGLEVVSPTETVDGASDTYCRAAWESDGDRAVHFTAISLGHPNSVTNLSQGMCLEVEMPRDATVEAVINGQAVEIPLSRLLEGTYSNNLGGIVSPAYSFHRAPLEWEYDWTLSFEDEDESVGRDVYYVRVRQKNDQWAWSSPVFVG